MITIFTATYNRDRLLQRLYHSLQSQTCPRFEWIIVDDGSTDETPRLLESWKKHEKHFPIRYFRAVHGGKHRAINKGVQMAIFPAFLIVDDDDWLTPDAVELAIQWFKTIENDARYAAVSGLKGYSPIQCIGGAGIDNGQEYLDGNLGDRTKLDLLGDKAEIYKTSIMKDYPFPEFDGENFISENVVWFKIAKDGYIIRWYKKIIYIAKYLPDGLTNNMASNLINNPLGWLETIKNTQWQNTKERICWDYLMWHILANQDQNATLNNCVEGEYNWMWAKELINKIVMRTNFALRENHVRNYAIYGLGVMGQAFLKLKDFFNFDFIVAIDRSASRIDGVEIIRPNEVKTNMADCVLITMREKQEEIIHFLKKEFRLVLFWKDLWE